MRCFPISFASDFIKQPVRLCLSASYSAVFFSHNKSASASQKPFSEQGENHEMNS
jgi:hypothetical protein